MRRIAILAYFFLLFPTALLFSSPLSFPELAARAQKATEAFLQNPPDCRFGLYDLLEDSFMEIDFAHISPEQPLHLPARPGLLVAKRCKDCIRGAADSPASASMINGNIIREAGLDYPQIPVHAYWLTGFVPESHVTCNEAITVIPNFYYAQQILDFFQKEGLTHPNIELFPTCGKFTEEELVKKYIENYGCLLGGSIITNPKDIDYQIHDWTAHFLAYLLMSRQKFGAIHDFLHEVSIIITEISEKYPSKESVKDLLVASKADTLYKNNTMSPACLGELIDHILSTFWSFGTQAMIACVHKCHPFLTPDKLILKQQATKTFSPSSFFSFSAPNLSKLPTDMEAHLKFTVEYLFFDLNNNPIFPAYPSSVGMICDRLRPRFSDAFSTSYLTHPTALAVEDMHKDFDKKSKDLQLTLKGYSYQSEAERRRNKAAKLQQQYQRALAALFQATKFKF